MNRQPDPGGREIGEAELRYIRAIEAVIREGRPITPIEFARDQGLAGTSSFKRYPTLKRILNIYGWLSAPERMRGPFPSLIDELASSALAAQEEAKDRLAALKETHEEEQTRLEARIRHLEVQNDRLKGLLSYTIAHFVGRDMGRGREIEARIRHWALELGADPEQQQLATQAIERIFASVGIRGMLDEESAS